MNESFKPKPYTLQSDEKVTLIFVYTPSSLVRGEVVTRQILRVSTWMRTQAAPDYMRIYTAQVLLTNSNPLQTLSMSECYVPASQVIVYHIAPPASDPIDYDPSEPNRKMEPVTVQLGTFRFNGNIRIASSVNLGKFLETTREVFFPLYDVEISNSQIPAMGVMRVAYVAVRTTGVILAARTS